MNHLKICSKSMAQYHGSVKRFAQNAVRLLPPVERKPLAEMLLRLVVDTAEGDKVRINLPMALVQMAVEFGMDMPQINEVDALRGVDLAQILRLVEQGAAGNLLEVSTTDGTRVELRL